MIKNILVTVNFNEDTQILIDKASEIAEKFNASIWIVHIAAPDPDFVGYTHDLQFERENRSVELRSERKAIQKFANDLKEKGIDAKALLIQGPTVETIILESEKLHADLVVMGHHEHGLLYKIFLGTSFPGIIRKSKIPVLVIPF